MFQKTSEKKFFTLVLLIIVSLSLILIGCTESTVIGGDRINKPSDKIIDSFDSQLVSKTNKFGINFLNNLSYNEDNVLISPTSIALALSMTYNGARGETKEAIGKVLGVEDAELQRFNENNLALLYLLQETEDSVYINIANSLWMREGLEFDSDFVNKNKKYYNAVTNELDFNLPDSADTINDWVYRSTGGLIEDIVESPIDPMTIMFLINAIYFQGDWTEPFSKEDIYEDDFYLQDGSKITAEFMNDYDDYKYYEEEGFQAVRIPYGEKERMGMYVFLPSNETSLQEFMDSFDKYEWEKWFGKFSKTKGNLSLPKFKMEYEKTLNDVLESMGMGIAFDERRADFYDMVKWEGNPRIFINEIKHKSFIEVDEKGTEAAAVTSVEVELTSAPTFQFDMKIDRPFLFFIHDEKTDAIIFMGVVNQPKQ